MGRHTQTQGANSNISPSSSPKLKIPDTVRILIVVTTPGHLIAERRNIVLREAGYISGSGKEHYGGM